MISPERGAEDAQALLEALDGAGFERTSDPDRASLALIYELTHGMGGDYRAGGQFIIAQSTTATLILQDWSDAPKERARISQTNQPGEIIDVPQGSITYQAPVPDLRDAKDWKKFVKQVKAAVKSSSAQGIR